MRGAVQQFMDKIWSLEREMQPEISTRAFSLMPKYSSKRVLE